MRGWDGNPELLKSLRSMWVPEMRLIFLTRSFILGGGRGGGLGGRMEEEDKDLDEEHND